MYFFLLKNIHELFIGLSFNNMCINKSMLKNDKII